MLEFTSILFQKLKYDTDGKEHSKMSTCQIFKFVKSFWSMLSSFSRLASPARDTNKDPTAWLDVGRPPPKVHFQKKNEFNKEENLTNFDP